MVQEILQTYFLNVHGDYMNKSGQNHVDNQQQINDTVIEVVIETDVVKSFDSSTLNLEFVKRVNKDIEDYRKNHKK